MSEQIQACNYRIFQSNSFHRSRQKTRFRDVKNVIVIIADYLTTQLCISGDVKVLPKTYTFIRSCKKYPLIPDMLKQKLLFDNEAKVSGVDQKMQRLETVN